MRALTSARIGERTIEVRGEPKAVAVYDFKQLRPQWVEHADGTGYPGSYHIEGRLTDTQHVSLTVDPDGKVRMLSKHYEPDPDLGGVASAEPSRYDPVRDLFPEEISALRQALKGLEKTDPAYGTVLERLSGKRPPPRAAPAGVDSKHLQSEGGKHLGNAGGVRGVGYDVSENASVPNSKNARIGSRTMEIRGAPTEVAIYSFAKIQPEWAEHADGTGYPGSYNIEARLTDTQRVSLTVEPDGKVRMLSKHFEPDPELGNVASSEPSRYDPVRDLFPEEVKTLVEGLKAAGKAGEEFYIAFERLVRAQR